VIVRAIILSTNYNVNSIEHRSFDYALFEEDWLSGFGHIKVLNVREGVVYTIYLMVNSIVIFNFVLLCGFLYYLGSFYLHKPLLVLQSLWFSSIYTSMTVYHIMCFG